MAMIALFTDFGLTGPYHGQMKAAIARIAPAVPVVDLFADVPCYDIRAAAYLLAAYSQGFPAETVFVCVVDPGVGTQQREPVVVKCRSNWFVGPDNGLFHRLCRSDQCHCWRITWQVESLSDSFHGRDLFAPVAARLALGEPPAGEIWPAAPCLVSDWPEDLAEVIYIDHFGNALTGIRASSLSDDRVLSISGQRLYYARTFGQVAVGHAFWYRNGNGLIEIAVNQGHAAMDLGLQPGQQVIIEP